MSGELTLSIPGAAPAQAAAIIAAIVQHTRDAAVAPPAPIAGSPGGWLRTARLEAVERSANGRHAWGAT